MVIGVAGGSGAGKSTAIRNLTQVLPESDYLILHHDNYYADLAEIPLEERTKTNFDHPEALETKLLVQHIKELQAGRSIEAPMYNFFTHTREQETFSIHPSTIIFVDGILLFEDAPLRELFDLKIFIDTPDDIRFIRRLQRDIAERGRTVQSVIDQYLSTVQPMYLEFVEPSKRYADVIIPEGGHNWAALDLVLARILQVK